MRPHQFTIVVALLSLLLAVHIFGTFAPGVATVGQPAWQYSVESIPDRDFDERMDALGRDGWELTFARRASGGDEMLYECIFKRRG